jgi:hypothetical protein
MCDLSDRRERPEGFRRLGRALPSQQWGNLALHGIQESYGMMVNYLYDPKTIEANHEALRRDRTVVRSPEMDALLVAAAPLARIAAPRTDPVTISPALTPSIRQGTLKRHHCARAEQVLPRIPTIHSENAYLPQKEDRSCSEATETALLHLTNPT